MASPNSYVPLLPSSSAVDERVKEFVTKFYTTSDDPLKNEEWVDYFLPDGVVIIGEKSAKGTEGLRKFRQGMWEQVATRKHTPAKVFPASFRETGGDGDDVYIEYMIYGSLSLVTKNGDRNEVSWAGRAVLKEVEGSLKYQHYEVYLHK